MSPLIQLASLEARKTAAFAMSSGSPRRCNGTRLRRVSQPSSETTQLAPSVRVEPGAMALTRILSGPNSAAADRVEAATAALIELYIMPYFMASTAEGEAIFTI